MRIRSSSHPGRIRSLAGIALVAVAVESMAVSTARGAMAPERGRAKGIQRVDIATDFRLSDYSTVLVEPIDVRRVERVRLGNDEKDRAMAEVIRDFTKLFLAGFSEAPGFDVETYLLEKPWEGSKSKTIIVRGEVIVLDPGSKGTRMMIGMGAGAARVELRIRVADLESGSDLVSFDCSARRGKPRVTGSRITLYTGGGSSIHYMVDPGAYDQLLSQTVIEAGHRARKLLETFD